jgi:hypothetical protein
MSAPAYAVHPDETIIAALREHGSNSKAAKALGVNIRTVERRRANLARRGFSPAHDMTHTVPEGYAVKGVSTLYGEDGAVKAQWVKSAQDPEQLRRMLETATAALAEEVRGLAAPIKAPGKRLADSLSAYIIGDAHFGLYAWEAEAGEDFDTAIASQDLRTAIDLLVAGAPESATGFLVDVGDFLHADSRSNVTPASGNPLDVDTRFQRVIRIAIDALKYCIGRMLQKHRSVKVFITPGNHNPDSAGWLALVLSAYYEKERRVQIETSPAKYFYERWGNVLIGITHGDKVKMAELPSIMASDRAKDWGDTEHRYWWTGHVHHTKHQEYRGCFTESFNTLAASDAWHHASGYRSARQMQRIDLDATHGIYNRGIANIGMIRKAAA